MFIKHVLPNQFQSNRPLSLTLSPKEKGDTAVVSIRWFSILAVCKVPRLGRGSTIGRGHNLEIYH